MTNDGFGRSPDETDAARHSYAKGTVLLGADVDQGGFDQAPVTGLKALLRGRFQIPSASIEEI
jgi:hypothetical protein